MDRGIQGSTDCNERCRDQTDRMVREHRARLRMGDAEAGPAIVRRRRFTSASYPCQIGAADEPEARAIKAAF